MPFPFTDLTATKIRPAVVVSANPQGQDVTLAFISSVVPASPGPFDVVVPTTDPSFGATGLKRASAVQQLSDSKALRQRSSAS